MLSLPSSSVKTTACNWQEYETLERLILPGRARCAAVNRFRPQYCGQGRGRGSSEPRCRSVPSGSSYRAGAGEEVDNMPLPARVQELIYLGDHIRARLLVAGTDEFVVKIPNTDRQVSLSRGMEVELCWAADNCRALDAPASGGTRPDSANRGAAGFPVERRIGRTARQDRQTKRGEEHNESVVD